MGFLDFIRGKSKLIENSITDTFPTISAAMYSPGYLSGVNVFDGEKNVGMVGPIRNTIVSNERMSVRASNMYLQNDIAKTIIDRYVKWIVSSGLDLELNPNVDVLRMFGIDWDRSYTESINQKTEVLFKAWSESIESDYREKFCFYRLQKMVLKVAIMSGDILVILRKSKNTGSLTVELIDSNRLTNPINESINDWELWKNGIKLDVDGKVTDFCIKTNSILGYQIIPAKNKVGLVQAFLFSMDNFRIEDVRGLSSLSASMDSVASADRYKDATVTGAEERAKLAFSIEHEVDGSGVNPMDRLSKMKGSSPPKGQPEDITGEKLTGTTASTLQKSVVNLPPGAKLNMHEGKTDKDFPVFIDKIFEITAAAIGIPVNVAMMIYDDSFSASRAAINDWMHTIRVDRMNMTRSFFKPIFEYWLYLECINGNLLIPQYLKAVSDKKMYLKTAFTTCVFVGEMFPHIDPVKEVRAEREKLGPAFANTPLTTVERSIRQLGNTDGDSVINQARSEYEEYGEYFSLNNENN